MIDEAVKLIFVVVGPILAAGLAALLVRLFAKAGIDLTEAKRLVIEQKLGDLVAQTEEWASVQLKRRIAITSADKATRYIALVLDQVPEVTAEEATAVAKTILGRFKVAASGSVSDLTQAAGKRK